jgi:integrase
MTLTEVAKSYLNEARVMGKNAYELECKIKPFLVLDSKPIETITSADIFAVMQNYMHTKQATRNTLLSVLKGAFEYAADNDWIPKNPLRRWRPTPVPQYEVKLTWEDLQKIWWCADGHLRWVMEVESQIGARPGGTELFALKWEHIDWKEKRIWVPQSKTSRKTGEKKREVPLTDKFLKRLREEMQLGKTEYVLEYHGRKIGKLDKSVRTAAMRAGITYKVRMYDIRHLWATQMIEKGKDVVAVSEMMGHRSVATTLERYYHVGWDKKREAIESLGVLGG